MWTNMLGCARGLGYVHEMGLIQQSRANNLLYSESSREGLLGGMGLVRPEKAKETISDVKTFGLTILDLLARARGTGDKGEISSEYNQFCKARPSWLSDTEWELLTDMCTTDVTDKAHMEYIVHRMEILARNSKKAGQAVVPSTVATVDMFMIPTLYCTVQQAVEEAARSCDSLPECSDVNKPVYDRLVDVYDQMRSTSISQSSRVVEDFCMILIRYTHSLERRQDRSMYSSQSVIASVGASRTLSGKTYSVHRDIGRLLLDSPNLSASNRVHDWQPMWKVTHRRQCKVMDTLMEDPSLVLDRIDEDLEQTEALALLKYEAHIGGANSVEEVTTNITLGRYILQQVLEIGQANVAVHRASRRLMRKLSEYHDECRLLVKLADTGRIVAILTSIVDTVLDNANIHDKGVKEAWSKHLLQERSEQMEEFGNLLANEERLHQEIGDGRSQVEVLTKLKHGSQQYYDILTAQERQMISTLYEFVASYADIVIVTIPRWFTVNEDEEPRGAVSITGVKDEEELLRTVASLTRLRHPGVRKCYAGSQVGGAIYGSRAK